MDRQYTINFEVKNAEAAVGVFVALAAAMGDASARSAEAKEAVRTVGESAATAKDPAAELAGELMKLGAVAGVAREAVEAIKAVGQAAQEAAEATIAHADANLKLRDSLRELEFDKGNKPGGDEVADEALDFSIETGLNAREAQDFINTQNSATNVLPAGKKPPKDVIDAIGKETARVAARADLDPLIMGKVAGLVPFYNKVETAEQGQDVVANIAAQLGKKGVFTFKQMMPAFVGMLGDMAGDGNRIPKADDAAAVFGAATLQFGTASRTATGIRQANRLMRRLNGKEGDALKAMGVTEDDDFVAALRKVRKALPDGKGDLFLKEKGFGNDTEIASVVKLSKALPSIEEALAENAKPGAGRKMVAENEEGLRLNPALRKRVADAQLRRSRDMVGRQGRDLVIEEQEAEARLTDPAQPGGRRIDTTDTGFTDWVRGKLPFFAEKDPRRYRIQQEAARPWLEAAQKAGIDTPEARSVDRRFRSTVRYGDYEHFPENFGKLREQVQARAGLPGGNADQVREKLGMAPVNQAAGNLNNAAAALNNAAANLNRAARGGGAGGAPARAPAPAAAAGAAPVVPGRI